MGKAKHLKNVMDFFDKSPVVSAKDIKMIVGDERYARLLLFNLAKRGKIRQITRGFYTLHDDPTISVFCFKPAYIGLQAALSMHDLWEQETNTVIITSRKARIGVRNVLGGNAVVHRISAKYFFGYEFMKYGKFYVPVSDKEKTLIDLIHFGAAQDKATMKAIRKEIDMSRLKKYLESYQENFRRRIYAAIRQA